ncbi:type I restriction enzyme, R subunit [Salegentibacter echinorum]|uniref:Type I restriction enzyme, R subunit n=1 Tax=Salegentibacter echinorum TaxID=1073325 RepID=A0A1M5DL89_SALEC|nr:DEAD/DEAH box helicase family protein [Salegentibacter echinorum]SHF67743.1 type I restriction enzyme, R subunit [Salegentibacter echinorum]
MSKRELDDLIQTFEASVDKWQAQIKEIEERNKTLQDENTLFQKQIEDLKQELQHNKTLAEEQDKVYHPVNEKETRRYFIDVSLREAGWDLKGARDKEFRVDYMPKSTNKTETGYIDYVLWDDDGLPLALVEAKKSLENAKTGENQAQLYADSLEKMFGRRPVIFYSNGFEIYIWDDGFYKAARTVNGFYTKAELQTLMYRREHRKDIRQIPIDKEIAGRTYQMRAIKSIAEHFAGNDKQTGEIIGTNRRALLVLATGTGKTRTSIALSKLLFDANWAKRILFLADRISLVKQAHRNFVNYLPEYSSVNLLQDKENPNTRLVFSTYKTMMNLIDGIRDGDERFYGVGHFDMVIIDEAHRSIYKKYQAIFEYFDALYLGLTATPKNYVHHNTYEVFGLPDKSPTDAYTFEEAVAENYLADYNPISVPTKFMRSGIKYSDLSPEEQEEFENEILDGEPATGNEHISQAELNKWLFNKPTAVKSLQYILKNAIKKRGGDEIGKTIIFARNRKHAEFLKDMFLEMDKEQFGNDYVKVITHSEPKSQEFLERFCEDEKERLPQIAISVDMMDTRIDAPRVVNLVFYKPVKSYTKFWQMIGRGSRLRPDIFGPGKDKQEFLIFDMCENFEFFNQNPEGIPPSVQKSITETVFNLKVQLAQFLKKYPGDEEFATFRKELLDELHDTVSLLDTDRFDVKMKIKTVLDYGGDNRSYWDHLDNKDIKILEDEIAVLIKPPKGDNDLARFYDRMLYSLMIKRLETPETEVFVNAFRVPIIKTATTSKKLLKKTSIPAVKATENLIKLPLDEDFWKIDGVKHLEKVRKGIRDLVKYIDPTDQKYVTTNFDDELDIPPSGSGGDTRGTYPLNDPDQEYKSPFQNNRKRLEEILEENKNHITITRIRNGDQITEKELQALEKMIFNGKLSKEEAEKEMGPINLISLIISLHGLSKEHVDEAFANFINKYQLNSKQIEFLNTIKQFVTRKGKIDPQKLYDAPFNTYHPNAVEGVFNPKQADQIFEIISVLNGDVG